MIIGILCGFQLPPFQADCMVRWSECLEKGSVFAPFACFPTLSASSMLPSWLVLAAVLCNACVSYLGRWFLAPDWWFITVWAEKLNSNYLWRTNPAQEQFPYFACNLFRCGTLWQRRYLIKLVRTHNLPTKRTIDSPRNKETILISQKGWNMIARRGRHENRPGGLGHD